MVNKMENVEVFTNTAGKVVISQDKYFDGREYDAALVVLTTEQARLVCEWVLEATKEIERARASGYRFEDEPYDPDAEQDEEPQQELDL